jgi:hypothetical protein
MPKNFVLAASLALTVFGCVSAASAEDKTFDHPRYKKLALDWCYGWQTDCGKKAADAWCVIQGYDSSSNFSRWDDIGEPTRVVSNGKICDVGYCDSFNQVTCHKADAATGYDDSEDDADPVKYSKPMSGNWRLDWCLDYGANCGKPAADYYCKSKGHDHSISFKIAADIGHTRLLKTDEECSTGKCDGFKSITCE